MNGYVFDASAVEMDLFSRLKGADAAPLVVAIGNQTPDNDTILWNVPYEMYGIPAPVAAIGYRGSCSTPALNRDSAGDDRLPGAEVVFKSRTTLPLHSGSVAAFSHSR
jgi:hypothetical protein